MYFSHGLWSEVGRKMKVSKPVVNKIFSNTLNQAQRLTAQIASSRKWSELPNLYSLQAQEAEHISNSQSRNLRVFGPKVFIGIVPQRDSIGGASILSGNANDGQTLYAQLKPVSNLIQTSGIKPWAVYMDLGHLELARANCVAVITPRCNFKSIANNRKDLKRRQTVETIKPTSKRTSR